MNFILLNREYIFSANSTQETSMTIGVNGVDFSRTDLLIEFLNSPGVARNFDNFVFSRNNRATQVQRELSIADRQEIEMMRTFDNIFGNGYMDSQRQERVMELLRNQEVAKPDCAINENDKNKTEEIKTNNDIKTSSSNIEDFEL